MTHEIDLEAEIPTYFIKNDKFVLNFAKGFKNNMAEKIDKIRRKFEDHAIKNTGYHTPELDFTKKFIEKINCLENESMVLLLISPDL